MVLLNLVLVSVSAALWSLPRQHRPRRTHLLARPVSTAITIAAERVYHYSAAGAPVDGAVVYVVLSRCGSASPGRGGARPSPYAAKAGGRARLGTTPGRAVRRGA